MKDTPAGVWGIVGITGITGITAPEPPPCPGVSSITGKPPGVGKECMAMGVPCWIKAELDGKVPPGGKKIWAIAAPEGIQGLALAIQSPLALTNTQVQSEVFGKATLIQAEGYTRWNMDTHTHTHARWVDGSAFLRVPRQTRFLPAAQGRKSLSRKEHFFSPGFAYCSGMAGVSGVCLCVCERERNTHKVKSLRTRHLQPSLLHPSFTSRIQKALLCRGESPNLVVKLSAAGREREKENNNNAQTLLCSSPGSLTKWPPLNRKQWEWRGARDRTPFYETLPCFSFNPCSVFFVKKKRAKSAVWGYLPLPSLLPSHLTLNKEEVKWRTHLEANRHSESPDSQTSPSSLSSSGSLP